MTTVRVEHSENPSTSLGAKDFILDSGCTAHLVRSAELLTSSTPDTFIPMSLLQANGSRIHTSAFGGSWLS